MPKPRASSKVSARRPRTKAGKLKSKPAHAFAPVLRVDPRTFDRGQIASALAKVDWEKHLLDLGWLRAKRPTVRERRLAVTQYQAFHGLPRTGELDARTLLSFQVPRCALPDTPEKLKSVLALTAPVSKWGHAAVTWTISRGVRQMGTLDSVTVRNVFGWAWDQWKAVCGIQPAYTEDEAAANVVVTAGPIDGAGGTLGWSQLPAQGIERLQQRFDSGESWVYAANPQQFAIDLGRVACHEIGHVIGLPHLQSGNLMQPMYSPQIRSPQRGDVQEVLARYGAPGPVGPGPDGGTPAQVTITLDVVGKVLGGVVPGFILARA